MQPLRPASTSPDARLRLERRFAAHLDAQAALCAALERAADALPRAGSGLRLLDDPQPLLCRSHAFEERELHPCLVALETGIEPTLRRLRLEHMEDEAAAGELNEALARSVDAERLGYMLRGVFRPLGRHLAYEREQLLPLLLR